MPVEHFARGEERERERKRGRRRKWVVVSSGAEKAEGESEEGKNVAQF